MVVSVAWAGAGLSSLSWGGMRYPLLRFFHGPSRPLPPQSDGEQYHKNGSIDSVDRRCRLNGPALATR